jgi:hypothetical protein
MIGSSAPAEGDLQAEAGVSGAHEGRGQVHEARRDPDHRTARAEALHDLCIRVGFVVARPGRAGDGGVGDEGTQGHGRGVEPRGRGHAYRPHERLALKMGPDGGRERRRKGGFGDGAVDPRAVGDGPLEGKVRSGVVEVVHDSASGARHGAVPRAPVE